MPSAECAERRWQPPAPRVLFSPRGCAKMMFIFFCFFTLCCKFAVNEYVTGIILEHVTASQPKPSSSLPVGSPGPGYQPDHISHPGGLGSHWGWAAGLVGVPRTPAYRERSPSLPLAGQGALPRFSEVAPSTRRPACGPAASGALVLSHALCPGGTPSPAPDLAQDWWRPEGIHRQFALGCAQPVGRSMGEGKAPGTHAWPSRWLLWPGQACTGSPPPPLTPVHQRSPAGGAARTVGHGVCAPRAGGSRRAWRHTAWDRPGTSSRQTLLGAVTAPPVRPGFLGSELRAGLLADRLPAPLQLPLPSSVSEAHRPTRPIEGSDASQGSG